MIKVSHMEVVPGGFSQKLRVSVDGDTRNEVTSPEAKKLALKVAADKGMLQAGFAGFPQVFAIDKKSGGIITEPSQVATPGDMGFRACFELTNGF